jgi:small glutamine-rich tetratricopeptide repeat-containing protein alpha
LERHKEAKESYEKALAMEPDNESYRNNLQLAEEKLAQLGVSQALPNLPGMDLSALLSNPALMNMARQMLSDPAMQNMMCNLMSGNVEEGGRMEVLIEA